MNTLEIIRDIVVSLSAIGTVCIAYKGLGTWKREYIGKKQIELYSDLWNSLYDLKLIADELWEKANKTNVNKFYKQLKITRSTVEKNFILLEDSHYSSLINTIDKFEQFNNGKYKLINSKNQTYIDEETIQNIINQNSNTRKQYVVQVDCVKKIIRKKINVD